MCVPIVHLWQSLVDAVIEVFVVGEDDMAANIVELLKYQRVTCEPVIEAHTKPSLVTSVEARPPGISLASTINHEGPFWILC